MRFAQRVNRVASSPTLAINAKTKALIAAGKDIINLTVGEPDSDTPDFIKEAAIQAITQGLTKYTPVEGTPELKNAILHKFKRDNALVFSPSEVMASTGGKQVLYNLCMALLEAGDEVIIPVPYWTSYPDMVLLADATPVLVPTSAKDGFKLTPEALRAHLTPRTRLVLFNSPSNPAGIVYSRAEWEALGSVLLEYPEVVIATDDLYEHIYWSDEPFSNILQAVPALRDRTLIVNGVSKAYAMTGWRIGYAAGPAALIAEMSKIQSQSTSNPNSIAQAAAACALQAPIAQMGSLKDRFHQRYLKVNAAFDHIPGVSPVPAQGAFYAFPDVSQVMLRKHIASDFALCEYLLEQGVSVLPGSIFGAPTHIRLSYALDDRLLDTALERLVRALK